MKALIVIDILKDFVNKDGTLYVGPAGESIISFINQKIREFRR